MKIKRALHILLATMLLLGVFCAPAMAKVASPGDDYYYLDEANVLSEALEGEIFFSNELLYDTCGAQIVVVTVNTTGNEAIDDYAYDLFNNWGIGDSKKNNGFLLLLAIQDDDYYALTGTGLSSKFSSGQVKTFNDDYLEPDFARGDYEAGVKKYFEAVFKRVADTYDADVTTAMGVAAYQDYVSDRQSGAVGFGGSSAPKNFEYNYGYGREESSDGGMGMITLIIILVIILLVVSTRRRSRVRTRNAFVTMPPPPPPPRVTRNSYGSGFGAGFSAGFGAGLGSSYRSSSRPSSYTRSSGSVSSGSRNSGFSGGSSRSGGFSSGSSRSGGFSGGGFGGARGGGGGSRGGGAGRGRH